MVLYSRRDFLRTISYGAAAIGFSETPLLSKEKEDKKKKDNPLEHLADSPEWTWIERRYPGLPEDRKPSYIPPKSKSEHTNYLKFFPPDKEGFGRYELYQFVATTENKLGVKGLYKIEGDFILFSRPYEGGAERFRKTLDHGHPERKTLWSATLDNGKLRILDDQYDNIHWDVFVPKPKTTKEK